ncbi:MAG: flagellar basal body rod protein FlgC [Chloroflexi bacterium]|nr:flagellar basal body rod protein FlgC [Chloroflexota bacterium]
MSLINSLGISRSALQAERLRMDVVANNLANMNTTRTEDGGPYERQTVLFRAADGGGSFQSLLARRTGAGQGGVAIDGVVNDPKPPRRVYEPSNPDADVEGYVLYPDIDVTTEMTDMMSASRAYQANVTALNAIKQMAQKALEIGR